MKKSRIRFIAIGLGGLLAVQVVNTAGLLSRDGARIQWPEPGSRHGPDFVASGDVWMAGGSEAISSLKLEAWPTSSPSPGPSSSTISAALEFPAERAVVQYQGRPLFSLPTWSARVRLPAEGDWSIRAVAFAADGRRVESAARRVSVGDLGLVSDSGFKSWSLPHLCAIAAVILGAIIVARFARRGGAQWLDKAAPYIAGAMWLNEIAYQCYWMAVGGWSQSVSLMLQMCGLSIILIPICLFLDDSPRRRYLADVLYFWGIGGAAQAILTPDIGASGFPSYRYFSFFLSHGLIIVAIIALAASGTIKIDLRSYARCIFVSNVVMVPIYFIDRLLALIPPYAPGNYFAIGYPPPTGSPIDLLVSIFGPAPRYIVGLEIMALLVFFALWIPWGISSRRVSRKAGIRNRA
jgi:hypothetical integral membrane protein (TIGR02206 family)